MDKRDIKYSIGLLDLLQMKTGCSYISDLHDMHFARAIRTALAEVDRSAYTAKEWNDAVSYMVGTPAAFDDAQAAIHYLLAHLDRAIG